MSDNSFVSIFSLHQYTFNTFIIHLIAISTPDSSSAWFIKIHEPILIYSHVIATPSVKIPHICLVFTQLCSSHQNSIVKFTMSQLSFTFVNLIRIFVVSTNPCIVAKLLTTITLHFLHIHILLWILVAWSVCFLWIILILLFPLFFTILICCFIFPFLGELGL
jgi:hypothetical protein